MTLARSLWPLLLVTLLCGCAKPAPGECGAWATTTVNGIERCGDDSLVRRAGSPTCSDGCLTDDDCGTGTLCVCNGETGEGSCEKSECRRGVDDCEVGECILHVAKECGDETIPASGFHCQTIDDDCALDADCAEGQFCRFVEAELVHRCFDQTAFSCD